MNNLTSQQRAALNIDKHICVTAGAGSGKTTVLVERYFKILRESGFSPRDIVAITFTDKAAAEMKGRIIEKLNKAEDLDDHETFLEEMNTAPISTIHAFCSRILREFPFQAGVPANFSVLQRIDQKLLLQQTIKNTLRDIATNMDDQHHCELRHSLQRYGNRQKLIDIFSTMIEKREVILRLMEEIYSNHDEKDIPETWKEVFSARMLSETEVAEFIRCLTTVLQVARGKNAAEVNILTSKLETLPDKDSSLPNVLNLLKEIADLITIKDGKIATTNFLKRGVDTTDVETEITYLESAAAKIKAAPSLDADEGETDDELLLSTTHDLFTLYRCIFDAYQNVKLSQGKLDFADLQIKTHDLLRNNEEIRQQLVGRYQYYMVDEFQDTNKLQYELIMLLTNDLEDANLFIVGDPKQSIYAFRGADVRVFDKMKQKIQEKSGEDIQLKVNFRSLHDPVGFVNHFFEGLMGDRPETEFEVAFEPLTKGRAQNANGAVEIILGQRNNEEVNEYALIAQRIKKMIVNEEIIWVQGEGRDKPPQPIRYGDIAILIRSRRHLPDIEHALLSADIPYLTTGGVGFYQRQEIYDIWNYLNFLNAPSENGTSLIGILRGPAFGISDTELYEISRQAGNRFWEKAQNYQTPTNQLTNAIATLKNHMWIAHRLPVNQLILTVVNETGLIGTLKLGKQGQQRWANYQKLLDLARNFDSDENKQILTDFIDFLDILITEEPREGEAPIEESSTAVQIMTIHSAKGKQFPVVILPCLNRTGQSAREPFIDEELGIGFSPLKPEEGYEKTAPEIVNLMKNRANAKDEAERKRLFYVGTTRAEDRLILSGSLSESRTPQNLLKWLYEHLDISPEDNSLNISIRLETYPENANGIESLELNIPIIKQLDDTVTEDQTLDDITSLEFLEHPFSIPKPSGFDASFSVAELANYACCALRYYLENVLRLPRFEAEQAASDETNMDEAIRSVLARIKDRSHLRNLENLIETASENYLETTDQRVILETHVNNFLYSEPAEDVLSASETWTNHRIHADVNGHIISGRIDRLFKDQAERWQIINYKTSEAQDFEAYQPEMELYALLFHKAYPNAPTVTIKFYFIGQNEFEQRDFNAVEFQEVAEVWQRKITDLQQGIYDKNLIHCRCCPYADSQGQCIITEP